MPQAVELEQLRHRGFFTDLPFPDGSDRMLRVSGGSLLNLVLTCAIDATLIFLLGAASRTSCDRARDGTLPRPTPGHQSPPIDRFQLGRLVPTRFDQCQPTAIQVRSMPRQRRPGSGAHSRFAASVSRYNPTFD